MTYPQYGVYMIPPPEVMYPLSVGHRVLEGQFGARVAGAFMVHCTLKGFFKPAPGASVGDFVPALDELFGRSRAFSTEIEPPLVWGSGKGDESVILLLKKNPPFQDLHNGVWEIVMPYVAVDCLFTPQELHGQDYPPHMTLVQYDFPSDPGLLAQGKALCDHIYGTLPTREFLAQDMQLIEFYSDDWAGAWWETLRYKQLKGWKLGTRKQL
jgi:hypothetical protein